MRWLNLVLCCCFAGASLAALDTGANPPPKPDDIPLPKGWDKPRIEKLLAQLGDEQFDTREAASKQLSEAPGEILPQLVQTLNETADLELRARLDEACKKLFLTDVLPKMPGMRAGQGFIGISWSLSSDPPGVQVQEVIAGTAAEAQGLQVGDLITKFGDHEFKATETMEDAWKIFRGMSPGDKVALKIHRDIADVDMNITVGEKPEAYRNAEAEAATNEELWEKYRKGELKPGKKVFADAPLAKPEESTKEPNTPQLGK